MVVIFALETLAAHYIYGYFILMGACFIFFRKIKYLVVIFTIPPLFISLNILFLSGEFGVGLIRSLVLMFLSLFYIFFIFKKDKHGNATFFSILFLNIISFYNGLFILLAVFEGLYFVNFRRLEERVRFEKFYFLIPLLLYGIVNVSLLRFYYQSESDLNILQYFSFDQKNPITANQGQFDFLILYMLIRVSTIFNIVNKKFEDSIALLIQQLLVSMLIITSANFEPQIGLITLYSLKYAIILAIIFIELLCRKMSLRDKLLVTYTFMMIVIFANNSIDAPMLLLMFLYISILSCFVIKKYVFLYLPLVPGLFAYCVYLFTLILSVEFNTAYLVLTLYYLFLLNKYLKVNFLNESEEKCNMV